MRRDVTGIVLAGGRSRRMGRDKAGLPFDGRPLLARVIARVAAVCEPVIIVARDADAYRDYATVVIADQWPGEGPLVGLHAGLLASDTEYAAAIACDLPFLEPALLAALIEWSPGWSAVVPEAAGRVHPLCAVYHRSVGETAEAILKRRGSGSLRRLLAEPSLRVRYVPEEDLRRWDPKLRSFVNLNTPQDYEAATHLDPSV